MNNNKKRIIGNILSYIGTIGFVGQMTLATKNGKDEFSLIESSVTLCSLIVLLIGLSLVIKYRKKN